MKYYIAFLTQRSPVLVFIFILLSTFKLQGASVLSKGNWYKFSIDKSGVYKLDYNFLVNDLKINPQELNTTTIGIFGYGGGVSAEYFTNNSASLKENNIEIVDLNSNGVIEKEDYILFYGDGPLGKKLNLTKGWFEHTSAYYTDVQSFFLTTTEGSSKKLGTLNSGSNPIRTFNNFDLFGILDKDSFNPNLSGRIWYHKALNNIVRTTTLNLPISQCSGGEKIIITYSYLTKLSGASLTIAVNNGFVKSQSLSPSDKYQVDTLQIPCPGSNSTISFSINGSMNENLYLDFITVNGKAPLVYSGVQFNFRFKEEVGTRNNIQFNLSGAQNAKLWDVTTIGSFKNLTTKNLIFENTSSVNEFVVFEDNNAYKPSAIGKIANQDLMSLGAAQNLIITHKTWLNQAKELAEFHKEERGIITHVVDVEHIYNEYNSGNKDISAIRRFISAIAEKSLSSTEKLATITLFGKACVDYKSVNKTNNACEDFVPTYETLYSSDYLVSFPTDDIYGLDYKIDTNLDDSDKTMAYGVGRLPVSTLEEAKDVVAKIKKYKHAKSYGDWRNQTTLVADDYDDRVDSDFYTQNEVVSKFLEQNRIKTLQNKVYLDAFFQQQFSGGQRYEDVEKLVKDNFTFGNILMTYVGHGGEFNWSQERILSSNDLPIYKNEYSLPFVTTATCGFAPYDKPNSNNKSAGERYFLQKDGGAIGLLTTCREVLISDQGPFMNNFFASFFGTNNKTLGDIARATKISNNIDANSQKVVLIGDPALELNLPKFNVVTTNISNGTDDTLKSLSRVKIQGEVRDLSNTIMNNFNGFCQITVLDKPTLNKLNYNDIKTPKIANDTFKTQQSRIFRGSTEVKDGKFSIEFIVPKDINYAIGRGKISYYAADVRQKPYRDASGMDTNVWIGGANLNAAADNDAPKVTLFMNDEKFAFGGITNNDPILLVKLFDSSGINTTGAGIGHDITGILDNNLRLPINLNSYYRTEQGDFMSGRINYPFYKLKDGRHTIKVKAWDVYNNPGEGYTEFIVAPSEKIALMHVLNYPNPFTTQTRFEFEHNRPNEMLDVSINIMTISGRIVKRIHQKISTEGFRVRDQIHWNGQDDFGDKIGKGVYIYTVTIRDSKGETASKYEKLVLLQ
ncbi:MAG: type IX secretion system sortase PorU [Chitinophagales bacterium]|nr:type IX secretion system sortase PorU [Chitinophagales bacterium]